MQEQQLNAREKELISYHHFKNGESKGLTGIYNQHNRRMYWHAMGLLKDAFTVETIVQEAFVKLWNYRDKIEKPTHIYYFLRRVITHDCITFFNKPQYRFHKYISHFEDYENFQDYLCGYFPEEEGSEQGQPLDHLPALISLLPSHPQRILNLCLEYNFHYKEIADLTGLSFQAVAHEAKQAIDELRGIIKNGRKLEKVRSVKLVPNAEQKLNDEQEKILSLRYQEGYSFSKIADTMDLPQLYVQKQFLVAYKNFHSPNP